MPRDLRSVAIHVALLMSLSGAASAADSDNALIITGKASGLRFSGNYDDAQGGRRFLAEADTAASEGPGEWLLERIRLTTFDRSGKKLVALSAPIAHYSDKTHSAHDSGAVLIEGDVLKLTGRDWRWDNAPAKDTFSISNAVRVVITPAIKPGAKEIAPTVINADRLVAVVTPSGKTLTFSGNVRVSRIEPAKKAAKPIETLLTCGELVVNMPGSGTDPLASNADREPFDSIDAKDGVSVARGDGAVITGRTARIAPGKGGKSVCTIAGDATFSAIGANRLKVAGDTMRYDAATRLIEVDPPANSTDGRVVADFQPIEAARAKNVPEFAHASGRKLAIDLGDKEGTLLFSGDVRIDDPGYRGSCDRLSVNFANDSERRIASTRSDTDALKRLIAEGGVSLTRKDPGKTGRTVTADRAEIFPEMHRIVLTGSPAADDPDFGVMLEAARVVIDMGDKNEPDRSLTADGDATRPVRAIFDPRHRKDALKLSKTLPGITVVEAGRLVAESRDAADRRKQAGVFRFEDGVKLDGDKLSGTCDRLGIEVSTPPTSSGSALARVRHMVATGHVKLRQSAGDTPGNAYVAEAGRAEVWPNANLRELIKADDNGLDGVAPLYLTLESDASTPGLRPRIELPPVATPKLGDTSGVIPQTEATGNKDAAPTVVVADHQELIQGEKRLRAFARGAVVFSATNINGSCSTLELLATEQKKSPTPADKSARLPEAIIARGGVKLKMASRQGDRNASADTLEIFPREQYLALTGSPLTDGVVTRPGTERRVIRWTFVDDHHGGRATRLDPSDEIGKGAVRQIVRPRVLLPAESSLDLGRSLKSLDNAR